MNKSEVVAMILAGGQGSRLGALTKNIAKPAVPFGGKYRIIDFTLSNCVHSGIETVGVLTQYQPLELNTYIGNGSSWDLDRKDGGVFVLPPYLKSDIGEWYKGTANAIYQNLEFIKQFNPRYVLVLSGDHIYKMHYGKLIKYHEEKNAALTIATINVPKSEISRFGIVSTNEDGRIIKFSEKPKSSESTLASMGIYLFNTDILEKYLSIDDKDKNSDHDFGKNVLPFMLKNKVRMFSYRFDGYWKDVGTIQSFWEANMDLLKSPPVFDLYDNDWLIYCKNKVYPPHFVGDKAHIFKSIITEGCDVRGTVCRSVISENVYIGENTFIYDSVIMPGSIIMDGVILRKTVIGNDCCISKGTKIGCNDGSVYYSDKCSMGISVIGDNLKIPDKTIIGCNAMVESIDSLSVSSEVAL